MMRSGRNVPTPAIPIPDFAVPYAAPAPKTAISIPPVHHSFRSLHPNIIENAMPACEAISLMSKLKFDRLTIPMNGANLGVSSESAMLLSAPVMRARAEW